MIRKHQIMIVIMKCSDGGVVRNPWIGAPESGTFGDGLAASLA